MSATTTHRERPTAQRRWGGATLAERKALRRAAIIDAALDTIGAGGAGAVTVRSLCRRTGLNDRYFYENFANREALLGELYQQVAAEMHDAIVTSTSEIHDDPQAWARTVVEVFVQLTESDPRKARLLLVEPLAEPTLGTLTLAVVPTFTRLVRANLPSQASKRQQVMAAIGLTGAIGAVFSAWLTGNLKVSREELISHCTELIAGPAV